ncbi:MAG: hypothetical protein ACQEQP_05990 [Bacillota bacterium]
MNFISKKIIIISLLLITTFLLSACDTVLEGNNDANRDLVYLSINSNYPYGIKTLKPGSGRYAYDEGVIAEIDFSPEVGLEFINWAGADGDQVKQEPNGTYIIKMNNHKNISIIMKLIEFMPRYIIFDDNLEVEYKDQIVNIPYNLEILTLKFNNKVNEANDLTAVVELTSEAEEIRELTPLNIVIEDNKIILDWYERIFYEARNDDYFDFGEEYKLIIKQNSNDKIFDTSLNEVKEDIEIDFMVEEPFPEIPQNIVLKRENNNKLEISWLGSRTNNVIEIDEYVSKYKIYKYINKDKFTKENADEIILVEVSEPDENKIIRKVDSNVDLLQNKYSYRIQAVNSFDNESELSEIASTY